jgi:hypothetical protein
MIFIQKDKCEWIIEDGTGLVKANTVFPTIVLGFFGIPFEYQRHLDTFPSYGRVGLRYPSPTPAV